MFQDDVEVLQTFQARESFFQDKTIGRRQGIKVGDTGEQAHSGFIIQAEPPRSTRSIESRSTTYKSTSHWKLRIRVVRAETIQYVEKAYVQDSVQLFFAVIAGVTGIFGIWTGAFYGWGVLVYEKIVGLCKKNDKTEPAGTSNMKAKQITVDKKINLEVNEYNADSLAKLEFQQEEIEELKRQLVENAKQVNEIPKLRRQLEELRNLLKNNNSSTKQNNKGAEIELVASKSEKGKVRI